ncbi:MAG TPA: hypothetical protein VF621_13875 [Pyrinomonadaceae bacterium]|jgi:hypothetical protein
MAAKLLQLIVQVVGKAARNPAVQRRAAQAAQNARNVFSSSKQRARQLCESLSRQLRGKKTTNEVLKDAQKGTVSSSRQFTKQGGLNQANKDFDALVEGQVKQYGQGVRVGKLPDGKGTVIVRPNSSAGKPTVEIQPPAGKTVKIRYD